MVKRIGFTIAIINVALKQGIKTIKVHKKIDSRVLKILYNHNIINGVYPGGDYFIININTDLGKKIKVVNWYRCNSKIHLTPKQIIKLKLHHQIGFYIFLTAGGFVNQHEILKKKISGILMYQVVLK